MKWFRMYSDALHNPKVQKLHPTTFKHWVNLLCLASENEPRGVLPGVDEIAFTLRVKPAEAPGIIETLVVAGLLDATADGLLSILDWKGRHEDYLNTEVHIRRRRGYGAARRARIRATTVGPVDLGAAFREYGEKCFYCNRPLTLRETDFDHYIPLARGGAHVQENIRPACQRCNRSKGAKVPGVDFALV